MSPPSPQLCHEIAQLRSEVCVLQFLVHKLVAKHEEDEQEKNFKEELGADSAHNTNHNNNNNYNNNDDNNNKTASQESSFSSLDLDNDNPESDLSGSDLDIRTRSTTTRDRNLQFRGAVSTGGSPLDFLLFLQVLCVI